MIIYITCLETELKINDTIKMLSLFSYFTSMYTFSTFHVS